MTTKERYKIIKGTVNIRVSTENQASKNYGFLES